MKWKLYNESEIDEIKQFLEENNNIIQGIPLSSLPGGIEGTIDILIKHGNILLVREDSNNSIVGLSTFTYGDPGDEFSNKNILYIYLAAILPDFRGVLFKSMGKRILQELEEKEMTLIRFKSPLQNEKNNKLYDKIAKRIQVTTNRTGHRSILYEINTQSFSTKLKMRLLKLFI